MKLKRWKKRLSIFKTNKYKDFNSFSGHQIVEYRSSVYNEHWKLVQQKIVDAYDWRKYGGKEFVFGGVRNRVGCYYKKLCHFFEFIFIVSARNWWTLWSCRGLCQIHRGRREAILQDCILRKRVGRLLQIAFVANNSTCRLGCAEWLFGRFQLRSCARVTMFCRQHREKLRLLYFLADLPRESRSTLFVPFRDSLHSHSR